MRTHGKNGELIGKTRRINRVGSGFRPRKQRLARINRNSEQSQQVIKYREHDLARFAKKERPRTPRVATSIQRAGSIDKQPEVAFKQAVYRQESTAVQHEPAKQSQNRYTEQENSRDMTEEEIYARLTKILGRNREDEERTSTSKGEVEAGNTDQRELEESLSRLRARKQELANTTDQSKEYELLQAKREAERREYPSPGYHEKGPSIGF